MTEPRIEWRGAFANEELNALHAECFEHRPFDDDWWGQVNRHSLGWACLRVDDRLCGFVNVAWDGGFHAFILDTMVVPPLRRQGLAKRLVNASIEGAREAGCDWLHVDFEPHLRDFYLAGCGFEQVEAGLVALR